MDYYLYVGFHDAKEKSNFDRCLFFAVQVCGEEDDEVTQFYKEKSNGVLSTSWNSKNLINTIVRLCDWDLNQSSYRVNGALVSEQDLMLFDLNEAVTIV